MVREATAARYREFYTFTYADAGSVIAARPGRGVELFLVGIQRGRRLPLRSAYGGFVVKNGVPIGYIEGLAFLERLEIGFNMYYTFREGESAWIYAQVLKLHRDALGVTSFSIDPYQLGYENDEAIESGAFWFYRKLGFRPTDPSVRFLVEREEARIATRPGYRSSPATLRRLVTHNLLTRSRTSPATGTPSTFEIWALRSIAVCPDFGADPARLRAAAERGGGAGLGLGPVPLAGEEAPGVRARARPGAGPLPVDARRARRRRRDPARKGGENGAALPASHAGAPTAARRADPGWFLAATICAMTDSAISSGERPPSGSPIGA
jgi:hypothetical protein